MDVVILTDTYISTPKGSMYIQSAVTTHIVDRVNVSALDYSNFRDMDHLAVSQLDDKHVASIVVTFAANGIIQGTPKSPLKGTLGDPFWEKKETLGGPFLRGKGDP